MRSTPPNILFIITDHYAFHHHYGRGIPGYVCPTWEQFCADGVCFDRAYSVSPLCTPARASMMTGVYPSAHGLSKNTDAGDQTQKELRSGQQLYSSFLSQSGYRNAYIGKWHCGHERLPVDYGIEGWSLPDYGKVYMSEAYQAYAKERGYGDARAIIEHNVDHPEWVGQTLTLHNPSPWHFMNGSGVQVGPPEAHEANFVSHLACEKLAELAQRDQPFSLVASFWGPHQPYFPSEPYASLVNPADIPEHPSFRDTLDGRPMRHVFHRELHHGGAKAWRDWSIWQQVLARAYGQAMQTDAAIGHLLAELERLGLAENTLVLWCADHGDAVASHGGLWDKASTMTEEVMRVPLAVRWPAALAGGQSSDKLVSNMDVVATMLEAAGCPIPDNMHSRSLLPLCRDAQAAWPDEIVCQHHGHGEHLCMRMLISGKYKYVAADFDGDELYDLDTDPHEMHNLIDNPEYADIAHTLRDRVLAQLAQMNDGWTTRYLRVALQARQTGQHNVGR